MGEENQINVLSIESKKTSRLKLQAFFKNTDGINLAAEAIDEQAAFLRLQDNTIDVVLLDLGLVDTDCIDLTKKIRKAHATVKVVVFTSSDKPDDIFAAMNAGADGYVLKGNISKELEMAIRSVRLGAVFLDPEIAKQVLQVMQTATISKDTRILPTGLFVLPLMPEEKSVLDQVAASNCHDGVCMVDPDFVRKLRRFAGATS